MASFELHGHRGARGLAPENTIVGFARALACGVDALELDVAMTADGVVVVSHDPALNPVITRDATGRWLDAPGPVIHETRHAALAGYDVGRIRPGTAYAAAFPDQVPQDGARIPTLAEVIALDTRVGLTIEIKTFPDRPALTASPAVLADAVAGILHRTGTIGRATVQSFDWRCLRHLRQAYPEIALAWLTEAPSEPDAVATAGGKTWAPHHETLTQALIAAAHALSLRVVPWTVNETADMARLIAWGVDGLITDRPDRARTVQKG